MGTLRSKLPLIIIVAPESRIVNTQIGVKVSKFLVVSGPLPTGHMTQRMRIGHFFARKRFTMGTLRSKLYP